MPRKKTGNLLKRPSGYYGRFWTTIEGEKIRVTKPLDTHDLRVARLRLARLVDGDGLEEQTAFGSRETFKAAALRIFEIREADGVRGAKYEYNRLQRYAFPIIGKKKVTEISVADINAVYDHCKEKGLGRQTTQHVRQNLRNVFRQLRREGVLKANPVDESELPKYRKAIKRERAVLTDFELETYLQYEHERPQWRRPVMERQVMACVSRMLGGMRTGDLHALHWEMFDLDGFEWCRVPRQKTKAPQLLEVPGMLRPVLAKWWELAGSPRTGVVFPTRHGKRAGEEKRQVSHANRFRRDLMEAFKQARKRGVKGIPRPGSPRWIELFEKTPYTLPVDFHSWRRAYSQALADADVNVQTAAALAGHATLSAHNRYLQNVSKMRRMPEKALPKIGQDSDPDTEDEGP